MTIPQVEYFVEAADRRKAERMLEELSLTRSAIAASISRDSATELNRAVRETRAMLSAESDEAPSSTADLEDGDEERELGENERDVFAYWRD